MNRDTANERFINSNRAKYNNERGSSRGNSGMFAGVQRNGNAAAVQNVRSSSYTNTRDTYEDTKNLPEVVGELVKAHKKKKARMEALRPLYNRKRVKSDKPFPIGIIISVLIISASFMFIVYNKSLMNDISYKTVDMQESINSFEQEKQRLVLEIEKKNDLAEIERIATTELGMVKSTDVYKQYVSISGNDEVVVSESSEKEFGLATTLDSINNSVGKIFE